jgi:hypothetical protein
MPRIPTSLETSYSLATAPVAEEKIEEPKAAVNVTKPSEAATGSLEYRSICYHHMWFK